MALSGHGEHADQAHYCVIEQERFGSIGVAIGRWPIDIYSFSTAVIRFSVANQPCT